jgi:small subunit ribosomal protein S4
MHRSRRICFGERRRSCGQSARVPQEVRRRFWQCDFDEPFRVSSEQAILIYRLGRSNIPQLGRTVRGENKQGNAGELLLIMCEKRLDNVVRRAGFTKTRPQARQGIVHGHFLVNGVKVTTPSFLVKVGDTITVRTKEAIYNLYKSVLGDSSPSTPDWISVDTEHLRIGVLGNPGASDISLPVDVNIVVEFLSR